MYWRVYKEFLLFLNFLPDHGWLCPWRTQQPEMSRQNANSLSIHLSTRIELFFPSYHQMGLELYFGPPKMHFLRKTECGSIRLSLESVEDSGCGFWSQVPHCPHPGCVTWQEALRSSVPVLPSVNWAWLIMVPNS